MYVAPLLRDAKRASAANHMRVVCAVIMHHAAAFAPRRKSAVNADAAERHMPCLKIRRDAAPRHASKKCQQEPPCDQAYVEVRQMKARCRARRIMQAA